MTTNNAYFLKNLEGQFLDISVLKDNIQFLFFKKAITEKQILILCKKEDITHMYHKKKWYIYMPSFSSYLSSITSSPVITKKQNILEKVVEPKTTSGWCFYVGKRRLESLLKNKNEKSLLYYENYFQFHIKPYRAIGLFLTSLEYESEVVPIENLYKIRGWLSNYISSILPKEFEGIESISQSSKQYKNLARKLKTLFLSAIPAEENFTEISDNSLESILVSLNQYSSLK